MRGADPEARKDDAIGLIVRVLPVAPMVEPENELDDGHDVAQTHQTQRDDVFEFLEGRRPTAIHRDSDNANDCNHLCRAITKHGMTIQRLARRGARCVVGQTVVPGQRTRSKTLANEAKYFRRSDTIRMVTSIVKIAEMMISKARKARELDRPSTSTCGSSTFGSGWLVRTCVYAYVRGVTSSGWVKLKKRRQQNVPKQLRKCSE